MGDKTDVKGELIADFIIENDLHLVNNPNSLTTFESTNGRSWIDLTVANTEMAKNISEWNVLNEPSGSDHNYIKIKAFDNFKTKVKQLTQKGQQRVLDNLKNDRWIREMENDGTPPHADVKDIIDTLYAKLKYLLKKHSRNVKTSTKQTPWWSLELDMERKRVRALRRRSQRAPTQLRDEYKLQYERAHKTYKTNIKIAKNRILATILYSGSKKYIYSSP